MDAEHDALEIIATLRREIEQAADMMLSAAERCMRRLEPARDGDAAALDDIELTLCAILEACAFQDLTGQRLTKLQGMIGKVDLRSAAMDPLLNGPALRGQGLDQAAADALLGGD